MQLQCLLLPQLFLSSPLSGVSQSATELVNQYMILQLRFPDSLISALTPELGSWYDWDSLISALTPELGSWLRVRFHDQCADSWTWEPIETEIPWSVRWLLNEGADWDWDSMISALTPELGSWLRLRFPDQCADSWTRQLIETEIPW